MFSYRLAHARAPEVEEQAQPGVGRQGPAAWLRALNLGFTGLGFRD